MKRSSIKSGMVLITRSNNRFLVLPFSGTVDELYAYSCQDTSKCNLSRWDNNLFNNAGVTQDDVVEVHAIDSFSDLVSLEGITSTCMWKRSSHAELMEQLQNLMVQVQGVLELI